MAVCSKNVKSVITYTEQPDAVQDQVILAIQLNKRIFQDRMVYEVKLLGGTSKDDEIVSQKMICAASYAESNMDAFYAGIAEELVTQTKPIVIDFFKEAIEGGEVITATEKEEL
jgi:hypothetical protein